MIFPLFSPVTPEPRPPRPPSSSDRRRGVAGGDRCVASYRPLLNAASPRLLAPLIQSLIFFFYQIFFSPGGGGGASSASSGQEVLRTAVVHVSGFDLRPPPNGVVGPDLSEPFDGSSRLDVHVCVQTAPGAPGSPPPPPLTAKSSKCPGRSPPKLLLSPEEVIHRKFLQPGYHSRGEEGRRGRAALASARSPHTGLGLWGAAS